VGEIAFTLCEEGKCKEAVKLNREVLAKQERVLGPEALAIMLAPAEAERLGKEALEIHMRVFGQENFYSGNSLVTVSVSFEIGHPLRIR
jgi:hypothetical protein